MKNVKLLMTGLTFSMVLSACGNSKSDSKPPATPVPPQTTETPRATTPGGNLPPAEQGPRPAPRNEDQGPHLPGGRYSPTPLPLPGRGDSRNDRGGNNDDQDRRDEERQAQRRRERQEREERERNARRDERNNTGNGGVNQGPTILPPGPTKPAVTKPADAKPETAVAPTWYPPQIFETPAAAWLHYNIDPMLKSVQDAGPAPKILSNRVKVTLALGYFDGYEKGLKYENENYGAHVAVDPFLRSAVDQVLTRDCKGQRLQVCGFELKSINDVEALYFRGGVDGIIQEVRVLSGALHPRMDVTMGSRAAEQKVRSARAEEAFSKAFLDSDMVVYVGHSRLGGGPDFKPPRLKNNKVDYPSYQKDREGARRTLRAVKDLNRRARVLALLSCDSTDHFMGELTKAGPDLQLATMKGNILSEDQTTAGLMAVDLFLRQGNLNGYQKFLSGSAVLGSAVSVKNGKKAAAH